MIVKCRNHSPTPIFMASPRLIPLPVPLSLPPPTTLPPTPTPAPTPRLQLLLALVLSQRLQVKLLLLLVKVPRPNTLQTQPFPGLAPSKSLSPESGQLSRRGAGRTRRHRAQPTVGRRHFRPAPASNRRTSIRLVLEIARRKQGRQVLISLAMA